MSFSWRAGKAFKCETCIAEGLFYSAFAAVGYQNGTLSATCGNSAENHFIPQLRLGGRRECVIEYNCRTVSPVIIFFYCSNVSTALVQYEVTLHFYVFFPRTFVHNMESFCQIVGKKFRMLRNYGVVVKLLYFRERNGVFFYSLI